MRIVNGTLFVSQVTNTALIFTDYPSIAPGTVFYSKANSDGLSYSYHEVVIDPMFLSGDEHYVAVETAQVKGRCRLMDEHIFFAGQIYDRQVQPFSDNIVMFDWTKTINRLSEYAGLKRYTCRHYLKRYDGLIARIIMPCRSALYESWIVFVGADEATLYEVMQYEVVEGTTWGDVARVVLDEEVVKLMGGTLEPGKTVISVGHTSIWTALPEADYQVVIDNSRAVLIKKS